MQKPLIVVSYKSEGSEDAALRKLAGWMGVETKTIALADDSDPVAQINSGTFAPHRIALSADTLAELDRSLPDSAAFRRFLETSCESVLVFGCASKPEHEESIRRLTEGRIPHIESATRSVTGATIGFPSANRAISQQFAGLDFIEQNEAIHSVFASDDSGGIMLADGKPVFLSISHGACSIFLLAGIHVPDIDQPASREKGREKSYASLIPFLLFLRSAFGQSCWHGTRKTARLIIDDPLLNDSYGWLEYSRLFASMRKQRFGATIAFIPWNHRRTSKRWTKRTLAENHNFSICIHGCDHTNREFSSGDSLLLEQKAGLSLTRLAQHEQRTRMPFEKVMVFPQGHFSKAGIRALARSHYLAAVNTTCFPTDSEPDELRIRDFLRPAVTRFEGFPIFERHYPKRLIDFAFDLFLGKPAFIVEHHPYFEDGGAALEKFVQELYKIEPNLSWPALTSQIERSCLLRRCNDTEFDVKFFTHIFVLENEQSTKARFHLEKENVTDVQAVFVDGEQAQFALDGTTLKLELELKPSQSRKIEIVDEPKQPVARRNFGLSYNVRVLLRRELSEFRDNALSKHPGILQAAKRIAKSLRVTGERKN